MARRRRSIRTHDHVIDIEAGLATTDNNPELLLRLMLSFRDRTDWIPSFRAAWEEGDSETMMRIAHTLKGVAGNIGANTVQRRAAALEAACLEGLERREIEDLLTELETALDEVFQGLATVKGNYYNICVNIIKEPQ